MFRFGKQTCITKNVLQVFDLGLEQEQDFETFSRARTFWIREQDSDEMLGFDILNFSGTSNQKINDVAAELRQRYLTFETQDDRNEALEKIKYFNSRISPKQGYIIRPSSVLHCLAISMITYLSSILCEFVHPMQSVICQYAENYGSIIHLIVDRSSSCFSLFEFSTEGLGLEWKYGKFISSDDLGYILEILINHEIIGNINIGAELDRDSTMTCFDLDHGLRAYVYGEHGKNVLRTKQEWLKHLGLSKVTDVQ